MRARDALQEATLLVQSEQDVDEVAGAILAEFEGIDAARTMT